MSRIVRWSPFRELDAFQQIADRVFDENLRGTRTVAENSNFALALDVHENDAAYTVSAALAGVAPENINIKFQDDVLSIEAEIPAQVVEAEEGRTLLRERRYGHFSRAIRLAQPVNSDAIDASYENGVLTLTLPKSEAAQPKLITVKTNGSHN